MVTEQRVRAWLDRYVEAWRTNDPDAIRSLFAEEATYSYRPWDEPMRGRDTIVEAWLRNPDDPDDWEAHYRPLLVSGDRAVAVGRTHYAEGDIFENLWLLAFDDEGRCTEFVEWYMTHPEEE